MESRGCGPEGYVDIDRELVTVAAAVARCRKETPLARTIRSPLFTASHTCKSCLRAVGERRRGTKTGKYRMHAIPLASRVTVRGWVNENGTVFL